MPEMEIIDAFLADGATETAAAAGTEAAGTSAATSTPNVDVMAPETGKMKPKKKPATLKQAAGFAEQGQKTFAEVVPSVEDFPSGGIPLLVLIALIVVLALVPAPGHNTTRLQLLWTALMGGAHLDIDSQGQTIQSNRTPTGSAGTDFVGTLEHAALGLAGGWIQ